MNILWSFISTVSHLDRLGKRLHAYARGESGAVAVLIALGLPVMIGAAALGTEVSIWYYHKQRLQSAADIVATSLAARVSTGALQAELDSLVSTILRFNKLDISQDSIQVTLSNPATKPIFINGEAVNVKITKAIPRLLTGFFQPGEVTIEGNASAQVTMATEGCILALANNSTTPGLRVENPANIQVTGCEVLSNAGPNLWVMGGGSLTADCARSRSGITITGILNVTCRNGQPEQEAGVTLDPYAEDFPDLDLSKYPNCSVSNATVTVKSYDDIQKLPKSLGPTGKNYVRICAGAKLRVGGNGVVSFPNWLFIFDGTGSEFIVENNTGLRVISSGTAFYFADGASPVVFAPNVLVSLKGAGSESSMLFRGARTNTLPASIANQIIVGPGSNLQGAIYFPASPVRFQATGNVSGCLQIIGGSVTLLGSWQMSGPCSLPGLSPIVASRSVRLTQ